MTTERMRVWNGVAWTFEGMEVCCTLPAFLCSVAFYRRQDVVTRYLLKPRYDGRLLRQEVMCPLCHSCGVLGHSGELVRYGMAVRLWRVSLQRMRGFAFPERTVSLPNRQYYCLLKT